MLDTEGKCLAEEKNYLAEKENARQRRKTTRQCRSVHIREALYVWATVPDPYWELHEALRNRDRTTEQTRRPQMNVVSKGPVIGLLVWTGIVWQIVNVLSLLE